MSAMSQVRRVAVFFCLAFVLLAALTPGPAVLPFAILIPLWFSIAIAISVLLPLVDEHRTTQQSLVIPAFSPRPPPAR
jgi:hypothetical protein